MVRRHFHQLGIAESTMGMWGGGTRARGSLSCGGAEGGEKKKRQSFLGS